MAGTALRSAKSGEVSDAEYQALAQFRRALRSFLRFSEEAARAAGLTPAQHQLLLAVRGANGGGPPTVGEIAESLKLKHHSTVELIDRAEAADLLRRVADDEDRRRQRLVLTDLGRKKLAELSAAHREELRRFREEGFDALRVL